MLLSALQKILVVIHSRLNAAKEGNEWSTCYGFVQRIHNKIMGAEHMQRNLSNFFYKVRRQLSCIFVMLFFQGVIPERFDEH